MTWTLAIAVTPTGIGAAKIGANDVPETTGYYPEVDRLVRFSAEGESTRSPDKTVLVVETGIPPQQLRWFFGELVISGIPADTVQVRSDVEVLATAYGGPVLLVDADLDVMVLPTGTGSEPIHAGRAEEIIQETGPKVVLVGHADVRGKVRSAISHLAPVEIDRADVARLALENPTAGSLVDVPRDEGATQEAIAKAAGANVANFRLVGLMTVLVAAMAVVAALLSLFT